MGTLSLALHYEKILNRRELIWQLALKGFKVRYKSPLLTMFWAVLKPLAFLLIFSFIFSFIGDRFDVGVPYSVFFLSGFVVWTFFSGCILDSSQSILNNHDLIKKIYFPREVLPFSVVLENGFSFGITFVLFVMFALFANVRPTSNVTLFPLVCVLLFSLTLGGALIAAALSTIYRDVRHIIDLGMTLLFYATPIFYPFSLVPDHLQNYYLLNPVAGIVILMRHSLLGGPAIPENLLLTTSVTSIIVLVTGVIIFKRHEPDMADYL